MRVRRGMHARERQGRQKFGRVHWQGPWGVVEVKGIDKRAPLTGTVADWPPTIAGPCSRPVRSGENPHLPHIPLPNRGSTSSDSSSLAVSSPIRILGFCIQHQTHQRGLPHIRFCAPTPALAHLAFEGKHNAMVSVVSRSLFLCPRLTSPRIRLDFTAFMQSACVRVCIPESTQARCVALLHTQDESLVK